MDTIYGTALKYGDKGILLRGPSGSGKSDLALRLIDRGAVLVSDDQVIITQAESKLRMSAPDQLKGLLEVRGVGIVQVPCAASQRLDLVVDLIPRDQVERLPEVSPNMPTEVICGVAFPKLALYSFDHSTPIKIELVLAKKYTVLDIDFEG
ncbi:HPr kinase/phosphorylase [Kordiimonas sp. SCSIO 12610]|uniref:HPr kinase/phosphorylase n=1 Tax=Kordiimonas sp. SCSIO 12610 TaxID=2829597 RepID=UPI00210CEA04|nr:HPr kinase/phosphatase C-terminal domain-containing protein [Kordiimonas sp. SCSIO 12610]UTW55232.1 HPr kinase/phosphatase C-terminal domain-containing protein [Kordiimonas sp. SCSIO 12610]